MIELRNKLTADSIGQINGEQLAFLIAFLEEEHEADQDYWLNRETLELMAEGGGDSELIGLLRKAMGEGDELEIEWIEAA